MHAYDVVKTVDTVAVSGLDTATLRHMQGSCRKWLGEHTAMLDSLTPDAKRAQSDAWGETEDGIYCALVAISAELRARGVMV